LIASPEWKKNEIPPEGVAIKDNIHRNTWAEYLATFTKRNESRPTWLQVFGKPGSQSGDHALPLIGISLEENGADAPGVHIMFGGRDEIETRHVITNVEWVLPQIGADGRDVAIEFVDKKGQVCLLIFKQ